MADCAIARDRLPMKIVYDRPEAAKALTTSKPMPAFAPVMKTTVDMVEEFHGVTRSLHYGCYIGCLGARLDSDRSLFHHYGLTPDGLTCPRHHRSHLIRHLSRRGTSLRRFHNRHRFCAYQTLCLIAILKRIDHRLHLGHANQQFLVAVNPSISNVHRCCDASLARFSRNVDQAAVPLVCGLAFLH